jgi:dihydropteroate synthase
VGFEPITWQLRTRALDTADHTLIMGILNVTPDSFSDGGRWAAGSDAIARGRRLAAEGADVVDVGGESTRPGAKPVPATEEMERVIPVVEALANDGIAISIDTTKPEVAAAAIDAGAEVVNDVAGLTDPAMVGLGVSSGAGVVIMHMQGNPRTMQEDPTYRDVVAEVGDFLAERAAAAVTAGIDPAAVVVDPGIGFGKTSTHNLLLLNELGSIGRGYPVLVGTSRKSFLGPILAAAGRPAAAEERDRVTVATVAVSIANGASIVRVHDVAGTLEASRTTDAIVRVNR